MEDMEEFSETPAIVFIIIGNSLLNTDTKNKKKIVTQKKQSYHSIMLQQFHKIKNA